MASQDAIRVADAMARWLMISDKPKGTLEEVIDSELATVRSSLANKVLAEIAGRSLDPQFSAHYRNGYWRAVEDIEAVLRDLFQREGIEL